MHKPGIGRTTQQTRLVDALPTVLIFIFVVALCTALFDATASAHQQSTTTGTTTANNPVALDGDVDASTADTDDGPMEQDAPSDAADQSEPANQSENHAQTADRAGPLAAQEELPIGTPESWLSIGGEEDSGARRVDDPQADAAASSDEAGNLLGMVDPRRNDIARVLLALALVIGLIIVCRVVLRRAGGGLGGGGRPSGIVEVLGRFPVGRHQQLIMLKVARRILLVHQNGSAMTTLSEISDPNEVANLLGRIEADNSQRKGGAFRAMLKRAQGDIAEQSADAEAANDGVEVVDLTRSRSGLFRLPGRRGM